MPKPESGKQGELLTSGKKQHITYHTYQDQTTNLQIKCQIHSTLRTLRKLEDNHQHTQQTTDIWQPLSTTPPGNLLAQHHLKCQPLGTRQTRTNRDPNQEEKMEMDRPHTQKKKQINCKAGPNMEPTRQEKEGKT